MNITTYFKDMWDLTTQGDVQGIFFFAALYAFVLLIYSLIHQIRITQWPHTTGQLIRKDLSTFGVTEWNLSDQDYIASVRYRYAVDGKEYEGHRVSAWVMVSSHNMRFLLKKQLSSIQLSPDGRLRVYYHPRRPDKSFLIKPGIKGQMLTAVLAILPFALYWLRYHG